MKVMLGLIAVAGIAAWQASQDDVTYSHDIEPILRTKCASCHNPKGPAPFSLLTYEDAKKRAALIRYLGIVKGMPPTDAITDFNRLTVHQPLNDGELLDIQYWVMHGLQQGEPTKPIEVPEPAFAVRADQILRPVRPKAFLVEGAPYREVIVFDPKLTTARYLTGFDVLPDQPRSVRQVLLAHTTKELPFSNLGTDEKALIGSWGLGGFAPKLEGGILVQPGEVLVASVLVQPSGKVEQGGMQLALQWEDEAKPATWKRLGVKDFTIPSDDGIYNLSDKFVLDRDTFVSALYPEMRRYAIQCHVTAQVPGDRAKTLMTIMTWDPDWAGGYNFQTPVLLPKGTVITATVVFDNSGCTFGVLRNEPRDVKWGPGPDDEIFWMHLLLTPASS